MVVICTTRRRISVSASTNQGPGNGDLVLGGSPRERFEGSESSAHGSGADGELLVLTDFEGLHLEAFQPSSVGSAPES